MRFRCAALLAGVLLAVTPVLLEPAAASNDRLSGRQWGLRRVDAERAWTAGRGDGATIAIIDTGVDLKHPDLKGSFVAGYDFVDDDADPMDEHGHGTHVAGIAAARADNEIGVAGVAPRAKIMPVRVLNDDGSGSGSDIARGVRFALDHGADVINLSLSDLPVFETLTCGSMADLAQEALEAGVVPVLAAGNDSLLRCDRANGLIVTATAIDDSKPSYATQVGFAEWGLAAPGGDRTEGESSLIYSTLWDDDVGSGYGWAAGTSMATPHVSGAAAILRGLGLDARKTIERILATAEDIGAKGDDGVFGHGLLDVAAAVQGLGPKTAPVAPSASRPPADVDDADPAPAAVPAAAGEPASPKARATVSLASPGASGDAVPSPRGRIAASDEISENTALANIILGGTLLAAAGALVGYGSLRKMRSR